MKQKRFGEQAMREALYNNYKIVYNDWFTLNAGYKVVNTNDEIVGYITCDLFSKLFRQRFIVLIGGGWSHQDYMLNPLER